MKLCYKNKELENRLIEARPFLKWAGGKTQLLNDIFTRLPAKIKSSKMIDRYIEPFVGAGAVYFFLKNNCQIKSAYLFDINRELILVYLAIQRTPKKLIEHLKELEYKYLSKNERQRSLFYYQIREEYNKNLHLINLNKTNEYLIERSALTIFLNKTCFNGLFRQNSAGQFNVPFGNYKKPAICNEDNIMAVHLALGNTEIVCGDFTESALYVKEESLVYLDPPYRPLSKTSSFTGYSKEGFNDNDQERLAKYFHKMDNKGAYLILSNSDPKNENQKDNYFDNLYYSYNITKVSANRMINSNSQKRGKISELIITNYE